MKRLATICLAVVPVVTLFAAGGCCKNEKEQILALQSQYNELSTRNAETQSQLAAAKTNEMELEDRLAQTIADRDMNLAAKDEEITSLQAKLAEPAPAPVVVAAPSRTEEGWDVGRYADKITVGSDILFASGRATLTAQGKRTMRSIASTLKSTYAGLPVRVYGYTDSDPIKRTKKLWNDNLDLSANRAMAVTRQLISHGIPADDIETVAMGETHFVAENKSRANKARNRRVEIVVIKK